MPKKTKTHRPKNAPTRKEQNAAYDARRSEDMVRQLYNTSRWRQTRDIVLARDPFCVRCLAKGIATPADTANHKDKGARRHPERFYDVEFIEGVCTPCHSGEIQAEERRNNV